MDEQRCKNCKHWEREGAYDGLCSWLVLDDMGRIWSCACLPNGKPFHTTEGFGCTEWHAKPQGPFFCRNGEIRFEAGNIKVYDPGYSMEGLCNWLNTLWAKAKGATE